MSKSWVSIFSGKLPKHNELCKVKIEVSELWESALFSDRPFLASEGIVESIARMDNDGTWYCNAPGGRRVIEGIAPCDKEIRGAEVYLLSKVVSWKELDDE